jgi:hypothetical protein
VIALPVAPMHRLWSRSMMSPPPTVTLPPWPALDVAL